MRRRKQRTTHEVSLQPMMRGERERVRVFANEGLGVAFLSSYAVAEEERGELDVFRLRPTSPADARLPDRPASPARDLTLCLDGLFSGRTDVQRFG